MRLILPAVAAVAVALVLSAAAPAQTFAPPPAAVHAGPMAGHATETQVTIWARLTREADVRVRYWPEGAKATPQLSPPVRATSEQDLCVHVDLVELPFGTRFRYEMLVDGQVAARPWPLSFRTQPHWRHRTGPPDLTFAFGSCAFVNEKEFDRPGEEYGGDPAIFTAIAAKHPDFMLWLGDNLYYREPDYTSESGMRRRYRVNRAVPELQPLLGSTHHYAIWDDHDFGPNDSDWTYALKDASLRTFRLYWANPGYGLDGMRGIATRFTWSDVEIFLLDNRYHRSPNRAPDGPEKTMFGRRQMRWLLDALTSSNSTFKIVAAGSQMLNPITPYEGWGEFELERRRFLQEVDRRNISGLLFLSGDRHHTELIRLARKGTYPLYDYTSSPLLSAVHRGHASEQQNPARVEGTFVTDRRNFGLIRVSGKRGERVLTMACFGAGGEEVWERSVAEEELRRK